MKKRISSIIALLIFAIISVSKGQINSFDIKKQLPTSPEAASLARFGDIPVGYYNGIADVSIPLYSISEAGLEIPITLRYHSGGVKVEDQANNVGLNWSLEPGGAIIQIINGKPDNVDQLTGNAQGYSFLMQNRPNYTMLQSSRAQIGHSVFTCLDPGQPGYIPGDSRTTLDLLMQGQGQPDIYQYSFPGGNSGKFYINPETQQPVLIDKSSEIQFAKTALGGWQAKTDDGNVFVFEIQETSTTLNDFDYTGLTWKLSKINLHNGKQINFQYDNGYYEWFTYNETYHSQYPLSYDPTWSNSVVPVLNFTKHYTKNLAKIICNDKLIEFSYEDRDDMLSIADNDNDNSNGTKTSKRIKSVAIKALNSDQSTYKTIKEFQFGYDYFAYTSIGGSYIDIAQRPIDVFGKRLKLTSLAELGFDDNNVAHQNPPYLFEYDESVIMPLKTSFSRDYWGYYNGMQNFKLMPDLTYFNLTVRNHPIPYNLFSAINGANRAVNKDLLKAYSLKKITYPTSGYTEFEYEPHTFVGRNYPDMDKLATTSQTVDVMDQNEVGNIKSQNFTLSQVMNIQFNFYLSAGHPDQGLNFYNVSPATIKLTSTNGGVVTTLRSWQISSVDIDAFVNNGNSFSWNEVVTLPASAGSVYNLTVELPDNLGPQGNYNKGATVRASCQFYDVPTGNNNVSYGGGLRIGAIKYFDSKGVMTGRKRFRYLNENGEGSGKIMSDVQNVDIRSMLFRKRNQSNPSDYTIASADIWFFSAESIVPFSSSAGGSGIGYSRVIEEELSTVNEEIKGAKIFNFHNVEASTMPNLPEISDLLNGKVEKEQIKNASGALMEEITYNYSDKEPHAYYGVKVNKDFMDEIMNDCNFVGPSGELTSFVYSYYPIYSKRFMMVSKITNRYEPSGQVSSNESMDYNSRGQMTVLSSLNSQNKLLRNEYTYPIDNGSDPTSILLANYGLYNHLLKQRTLVDGVEIYNLRLNYRLENAQVVQADIVKQNIGYDAYQDVSFDRYGDRKTLQQFSKSGQTNCILWSFGNSRPIAEIKNASMSSVQQILGAEAIIDFANKIFPTDAEIKAFLLPLRTNLSTAFVTSYTYKPLAGVSTVTDAKGMTTYYEYDAFQRLKTVKDQNGNILKQTDYHYKN